MNNIQTISFQPTFVKAAPKPAWQ